MTRALPVLLKKLSVVVDITLVSIQVTGYEGEPYSSIKTIRGSDLSVLVLKNKEYYLKQ
jgi:hypothetical protein